MKPLDTDTDPPKRRGRAPMATERDSRNTDFEAQPLSRSEYIAAMVHFYRGEVDRANTWRQRLDNTTNWAVVTSAGVVTFTFSAVERTHLILLLSNFIILGFLFIEARRFRFFSVYRARVRMLEENFVLPILTRDLISPKTDWRELVAMDLDVPKFKNTLLESLALRVRYNYYWIFSAIMISWCIKIWIHPHPANSLVEVYEHMAVGNLPGWAVLAVGLAFFGFMTWLFFWGGRRPSIYEDEIHGYETQRAHWKY